ncbi:MAG: bacterioferritin [Gammaproteobacteria bacterium]|jgi:bacterioferritin-associated ferredoxin|nr:bacterioferritin [Gammaproteobacteria bacterium]
MYVCVCNKVTDRQIRAACDEGAYSMECLQSRLKVATCCGRCAECAQRMLNDATVARFNEQPYRAAA